jgi:hypothetical protein
MLAVVHMLYFMGQSFVYINDLDVTYSLSILPR